MQITLWTCGVFSDRLRCESHFDEIVLVWETKLTSHFRSSLDFDLEDEEDVDKIREQRRKERDELLKVSIDCASSF